MDKSRFYQSVHTCPSPTRMHVVTAVRAARVVNAHGLLPAMPVVRRMWREKERERADPPFRDSTKTIVKLMSHANGLRGTALSHLRLSQIDKRFFNIGISRFRDNFLLISCHSFFPLRKNVNLSCLYLCDIALDLQSE